MSMPSSLTLPSTRAFGMTSCIRLSERRNVLLPQPDGPMIAVMACGWMVEADVADGPEGAVVDVEALDVEPAGASQPPGPARLAASGEASAPIGTGRSGGTGSDGTGSAVGVSIIGVGRLSSRPLCAVDAGGGRRH